MATQQSEATTSLMQFCANNPNVKSFAVINGDGVVCKSWYCDGSKDHQYFVTQASAVLQVSALTHKTCRNWGSGTADDGGNTTIRIRTKKLTEFIILTYGDYYFMVEQDCSFAPPKEEEEVDANAEENTD